MHYGGQRGNSGRSWLLFTQCSKHARHLYIVNNEIIQLMHYVDQWHMQGLRGGEKKLVINLYLELGFRPRLCVRLLFIHVRRCVCESWFDNLHTISPWARVPLKKQYLLWVGSTRRRRGDASGGRRLSITGGRVWVFQQRSTSERSAAHAKPRIIK